MSQPTAPAVRRYTLDEYRRHVALFGPECVLEVAAGDLDRHDLGALKAYIDHRCRVERFRAGQWVHRGQEVRACDVCGLDLPRDASRRMRRHRHCKDKLQYAKRRAVQTEAAPTRHIPTGHM
jgi:hypothetical protein